ncbi:MAG TPA: hypothetical protein VMW75_03200 [Thermoanaerobaculia bacterium]|nr:hypothetical protein [Thermoanaerobaculia bacterium]
MTTMTLRPWFVAGMLFTAGAGGVLAQGLACQQDCSSGACLQAECAAPSDGDGFCQCVSGAAPLGADLYAAYCRAWGPPQPGCRQALPPGQAASAPTPAATQLPNASAMAAALSGQNPFVAGLVAAMQDGRGNFANARVQGLVHDIHHDADTGALSEGTAVPFTGQATPTQAGSVQIDIVVQGDVRQLAWLAGYCATAVPAAIAPTSVHGQVAGGGLHGNLLVLGSAGQSQTVQW